MKSTMEEVDAYCKLVLSLVKRSPPTKQEAQKLIYIYVCIFMEERCVIVPGVVGI